MVALAPVGLLTRTPRRTNRYCKAPALCAGVTHMGIKFTILVVQEGTQAVALCLEYFIAAQGSNVVEALKNWSAVVSAQFKLDDEAGRHPLEGIEPAPERYKDMLEGSSRDLLYVGRFHPTKVTDIVTLLR